MESRAIFRSGKHRCVLLVGSHTAGTMLSCEYRRSLQEPSSSEADRWLSTLLTQHQAYTGSDLTLQTMNWTSLIYGGAMFLAMSYYAIDARKWFKGPRINIAHVQGNNVDHGSLHSSERIPEKER